MINKSNCNATKGAVTPLTQNRLIKIDLEFRQWSQTFNYRIKCKFMDNRHPCLLPRARPPQIFPPVSPSFHFFLRFDSIEASSRSPARRVQYASGSALIDRRNAKAGSPSVRFTGFNYERAVRISAERRRLSLIFFFIGSPKTGNEIAYQRNELRENPLLLICNF